MQHTTTCRWPRILRNLVCGKLPVSSVVWGFSCVIIVRTILEGLLENTHCLSFSFDYYVTLVEYAHIYISWVCLFVAAGLLTALFMRIKLKRSLPIVLFLSPVVITVPLVDYLYNRGGVIKYGTDLASLPRNYVNLFNPWATIDMVTPGVRIEMCLVVLAAFCFALLAFRKSVLLALSFASALYTTVFIFGYLPALLPVLPKQPETGYFALYIPLFLILMALVAFRLWFENRKWAKVAFHLLYPSRLLFYIYLIAFGMIFTAKSDVWLSPIASTGGMITFVLAVISICLLFIHAKIQNDFFDQSIDHISDPQRPVIFTTMPEETARSFGWALLVPAFAFALAAGRYFIFLWFLIWALSALYSEPPFRLRRFYPLGHCVLSLLGCAVFLAGAALSGSGFFSMARVSELACAVFFAFFFLSHVKDFKDIRGDFQGGVMNVFNLTKFPRVIGLYAVCGFAATLIYILPLLSIDTLSAYVAVGLYVFIAAAAILTAAELVRLDWLIPFSGLLVLFISILWISQPGH